MLGVILALGFAAFFGANSIIVRRGVLRASPNYVATLTIFTGPVFFFLTTLAAGELSRIPDFSWKAILFFALSGIVHFALGRTFGYRSVQILGATRSGIVTGLNAIVTVILAIIILKETVTPLMVLGMCFSLSGPILIALKEGSAAQRAGPKTNPHVKPPDRKTFYHGLFFGIGSAFFWGSSSIFIKLGLDNGGTPLAGSFIAYCAATLIVGTSLLNGANRTEIFKGDRQALRLACMSGMATNIAQMLRYVALNYATAIVVSLVSRTIPIWTLTLSFIFNRKVESFSRWVLVGNGLLTVGTILVLL